MSNAGAHEYRSSSTGGDTWTIPEAVHAVPVTEVDISVSPLLPSDVAWAETDV